MVFLLYTLTGATNGGVWKGGQAYRDIFTQGQHIGLVRHDEMTSTFKHGSDASALPRRWRRLLCITLLTLAANRGWKVRPAQVSFFYKPTILSVAHHSPDITIGYLAGTNMLLHNGLTAYIDFFLDPQEETTSRFRPVPAAPDTTPFCDPEYFIGPGDLDGLSASPVTSPCR